MHFHLVREPHTIHVVAGRYISLLVLNQQEILGSGSIEKQICPVRMSPTPTPCGVQASWRVEPLGLAASEWGTTLTIYACCFWGRIPWAQQLSLALWPAPPSWNLRFGVLKEVGCCLGKEQLKTSLGLWKQQHSSFKLPLAHMLTKAFLLEVQGPGW